MTVLLSASSRSAVVGVASRDFLLLPLLLLAFHVRVLVRLLGLLGDWFGDGSRFGDFSCSFFVLLFLFFVGAFFSVGWMKRQLLILCLS